jgi:hypothetical protein
MDLVEISRELEWLKKNPAFERRPATITEFLHAPYLDIWDRVRPGLRDAFVEIFGEEVRTERIAHFERAMFTGGIGIGKTTFASIALPYMAHWVLCLKDPQEFYGLLPGSRIAFMQMSTSARQAREVIFGDIKARIKHSTWFAENFPFDDAFTNQIRFPKDIWIIPGDSGETTFEGYNILGGILDEMDSHKQTQDKDYADDGYNTIESRIASRFVDNSDPEREGHKGLILCIGQMKKAHGFASRKFKEFQNDDKAKVVRMTIWESMGWDKYTDTAGNRRSFYYDTRRKSIVPAEVVKLIENPNIIEVPRAFKKSFENNPEKALRDLAGIPPETEDAFISLADRVDAARDRWVLRHGDESPVSDDPVRPKFADWFRADNDPRRRSIHLDLAVSGDGDALGFAMGHIEELVEVDGEKKPYIVFDCLIRIKAPSGTEIILQDVRQIIYHLRDDRHFRIKGVTMDGFQSTDSLQQFRRRRMESDYLSVDKSTLPYEDLREAIYENRVEFPPYMTYMARGSKDRVEIAIQELLRLQFDGKKVDHPTDGSKDVADAMAGVCFTLMGDRNYRKGVTSLSSRRQEEDDAYEATGTEDFSAPIDLLPSIRGLPSLKTPPVSGVTGGAGFMIPDRLRNRTRG